jgi:hypothetical protein
MHITPLQVSVTLEVGLEQLPSFECETVSSGVAHPPKMSACSRQVVAMQASDLLWILTWSPGPAFTPYLLMVAPGAATHCLQTACWQPTRASST